MSVSEKSMFACSANGDIDDLEMGATSHSEVVFISDAALSELFALCL